MGCAESNATAGTAAPIRVEEQKQPKSSAAFLANGAEY